MMNSIQITIEANELQQEILISQLSDLGAEGFEQTERNVIAYFNENIFRSYEINELLKNNSFYITTIQERNWNEEWEHSFQPVIVNNFCMIRASFHQSGSNVQHEIIITPKMSFGTGHHATTYMMIEKMKDMDFKNKTVLDFGTGTGVLAIFAEKLGASNIIAIDVDHWSVENAKENIAQNHCSKISIYLSSKIPDQKFDIILANIDRNVLVGYKMQLKKGLKKNGCLLLSGLLQTDEEDIVKHYTGSAFQLFNKTERNNWIALLFRKQ